MGCVACGATLLKAHFIITVQASKFNPSHGSNRTYSGVRRNDGIETLTPIDTLAKAGVQVVSQKRSP